MFSRERLKEVMRTQGRTVNWLAEITEYDPATVARYMSGAYPISEKFAQRASRALGVPIDWLRDESPVASEPIPA